MPNWLKIALKIIGDLVLVVILIVIGVSIYISSHKEKVLSLVTTALNKNLNGKLAVGGMETSFFKSFPDFSIELKNVSLKDKEWARHHQTFLEAKDVAVSVNAAELLKGTIFVNHIDIGNAAIDLYTDSTGYSNTSIFKKNNQPKNNKSSGSSSTEINKFSLSNVTFTIDDQRAKKLFKFSVNELKSKVNYPDSGWNAELHLNVLVKSMAFKLNNGSFLKDKVVEGNLKAAYNTNSGDINVVSSDFLASAAILLA